MKSPHNWYVVQLDSALGGEFQAWKLYDFEPLGGAGWGAKGPPRSHGSAVKRAAMLNRVAEQRRKAA